MDQGIALHVPNATTARAIDWYKRDAESYTEIGEVVHRLKYTHPEDVRIHIEGIRKLVDMVEEFLGPVGVRPRFTAIIPAPSTDARTPDNPKGQLKIPYTLACALAEKFGTPCLLDTFHKRTDFSAKDATLPKDPVHCTASSLGGEVMIVDDFHGSGATANACVNVFHAQNPSALIHFYSLTKNRFGGLGKSVTLTWADHRFFVAKNGSEYVRLHFTEGESRLKVNAFADHPHYPELKELLLHNPNGPISARVLKRAEEKYWDFVELIPPNETRTDR